MKRRKKIFILGIIAFVALSFEKNEDIKPILWLSMDDIQVNRIEVEMVRGETFLPKEKIALVRDKMNGQESEILGKYYESVSGVINDAVLLDGISSYIEVTGDRVPVVSKDFSIEAWIALGAYPTHVCPIVDNKHDVNIGYHNGYSFNIDALGRLSFKVATRGQTEELVAPETLPLNTWHHVAAVCSAEKGMQIFLNGKQVGEKNMAGGFIPSVGIDLDESVSDLSLLIGRSRNMSKPYGTLRPYGTQDMYAYYDGIIDEIRIYDEAVSPAYIARSFEMAKKIKAPTLPDRTLPSGPDGPAHFGAFSTTLKYYPAWDAPWHVGDHSDVVVRFDESPCKLVFWRGTNYIPNFVTENGIWFNNAFNEGWNEHGSCEPMSDKRNTYSHVKIIESNDARVVVLWRYGLVDNWNKFAFQDPSTGWGDWVEETYYIYPDMTGIRKDVLYSNAPRAAHEWQESCMVLSPGQIPEDILEYGALTLLNLEGKTYTYSWEHEVPPVLPEKPDKANIKMINTKSTWQPFSMIRPQDNPYPDIYAGEIRREVSVFPWWNHWPVATKPTDGRYAMFADRPAHSSLSHWHWEAYEMTDKSVTKLMLLGMTDNGTKDLVTIAKSWAHAPEILTGSRYVNQAEYNPAEKAYSIDLSQPGQEIQFTLNASKDEPMHNPAFVLTNWGESDILVNLNSQTLHRGKDFRYGHRQGLETTDLIIWIKADAEHPITFTVKKM
jgi:hypothetical protein